MADMKQEKVKAQENAINAEKDYQVRGCKGVFGYEAVKAEEQMKFTSSFAFRLRNDLLGVEKDKANTKLLQAQHGEKVCIADAESKAQMALETLRHPKSK